MGVAGTMYASMRVRIPLDISVEPDGELSGPETASAV